MEQEIERLQELYQEIGTQFSQFQNKSGLTCLEGCGDCCNSPDVSASVFEMLPLARNLIKNGQADHVEELLREKSQISSCLMYQPTSADKVQGRCGVHPFRPLLCRVFGAYARKSKHEQCELCLCKKIKNKNPLDLMQSNKLAETAPNAGEWRTKIDELSCLADNRLMPINQALKLALERLRLHLSYHDLNGK